MKSGKHQESWHEAALDLRTKLSRYSSKARFNEEFEDAFSFFFGEGPDEMQDDLEPAAFSRFMEWFVYDYRLSNGHRLIELFELEYANELSCRSRYLLEEWQKSCLTLLEILDIGRETTQVRDLLLGGVYSVTVLPPSSTQGLPAVKRLIIGRLMRVGDVWEIPGGATIMPERLRARLLQLIRGEFRRFHRNRGGNWQDFLREQGFVFNDLIDNLSDELEWDADAPIFVRAVYDIVDVQACMRAMRGNVESAQVAQRSGDFGLATQTPHWPGLLGDIRLAENRLELVCASPEELAPAKLAVSTKLGNAVCHRIDVYERRSQTTPRKGLLRTPIHTANGADPTVDAQGVLGNMHTMQIETAAASELESVRPARGRGSHSRMPNEQQELLLDDPLPAASQQPVLFTEEQREVSRRFCKILAQTGVSQEHLDSALWIWSDFCSSERPRIRHVATWATAVHITLGRVEGWKLRNSALARVYGAKPASVSKNAAMIAAALDVRQFDDRYCVEHPVDGLLKRLGAATEIDGPQQAEEILGASLSTMPTEQTALLARLVQLRGALAAYAQTLDGLQRRAHDQFFGHVGCSDDDTFWQDCFNDWFHFDWAIPVRGGLTVLEEALANNGLEPADAEQLNAWCDCHPAYFVVDAVQAKPGARPSATPVDLVLKPLRGEGLLDVAWPLPAGSLKKGDVILARLVPVDGVLTSVGHALHFNASLASAIRLRLDEERALLDHWNGRRMKWEEVSARYAERLYAIAYRAARGFPDED